MKKWYMMCRWIGYVTGLLGMVFVVILRNRFPVLEQPGIYLLGVMFCAFLLSYVIYAYVKFTR
jgi:hypothetical protein